MSGGIPAWGLYGEENADQIGAYHVEPLRLRSAAHNWEIAPHLHKGLAQLFLLVTGRLIASVDGVTLELTAPAALTMPPATAHALSLDPGSEGQVITFRDLAHPALDAGAARTLVDALFARPSLIDLTDTPDVARQLLALADNLTLAQAGGGGALAGALYLASIMTLLESIRRASSKGTSMGRGGPMRAFRGLVDQHFAEHWTVAQYAAALKMSESTLDRLCRAAAGRSAFQLIRERLLIEARRRLAYTAAPAAEIGADLGFADPAYFSRFIKAGTGYSSRELRSGSATGSLGNRSVGR